MPESLMQLLPTATSKQLALTFPHWLASIAFREYITQLSGFLEKVGCVLSLIDRIKSPGEDWNQEAETQRINRMSFPAKLSYIEDQTEHQINSALRNDLERINQARNCFEHRRGIVGSKDASNGRLEVTWRVMQLLEQRDDGVEIPIATIPHLTAENSAIIGKVAKRAKVFSMTNQLQFTGPEVWEISISIIAGIRKISGMVETHGRRFANEVTERSFKSGIPTPKGAPVDAKMAEFLLNLYPDE